MNDFKQTLDKYIEEYLSLLDTDRRDEWYTTERGFADGELSRFTEWLDSKTNI